MIICMPVTEDKGKDSPLSPHFGSAPFYVLADTNTLNCQAIPNKKSNHAKGCRPLAALQGLKIDAVAVRGIGPGALAKLKAAGLEVLFTPHGTVADTVREFGAGGLKPVEPQHICAHSHGGNRHGQQYGRFVRVQRENHGCSTQGHGEHGHHGPGCHGNHCDD